MGQKKRELINHLRKRQNILNKKLTRLLLVRFDLSNRILELKRRSGAPMRDRARERSILRNAAHEANSPQERKFLIRVFRSILEETIQNKIQDDVNS
mgnify:CR=1 FL=1